VERVERLEDRTLLTFPAPFAAPDSYAVVDDSLGTTAEGKPSVLANDYDMNNDPLTAVLNTGVSQGTLTLNSNGHFTYAPTLGYAGSDSFTYKAYDGTGYSASTTVTLNVTKPLSAQTNLEDRPSTGVESSGVFGTSAFTGDVHVTHAVGDGYTLRHQALSDPRPVIAVEASYSPGNPSANNFEVRLTFNGVAQPSVWYGTGIDGGTVRFAVQADATALATGRYAWTMNVLANYAGGTATHVYSGNAEIVNLNDSNFGDGWSMTELDRLVSGSGGVLFVRGDGVTAWFTSTGGGNFSSQAGPYATDTLIQNGDNTYRLTDKFGNQSHFSSAGLLTSRVDRNNNTTSFVYVDADTDGQVDELSTITDPWGRVTTFAYTSGLLATVTDHANQVTTVAQDGPGRITSITAPDPDGAGPLAAPVTAYTSDGTSRRIASITDPLNHVTQFQYDFSMRVKQATDPASTTRQFTTWQRRALPDTGAGQGTQSNPMPLYFPDSLSAWQQDGMGGSVSTRHDRFGNLTLFKDLLGNSTSWIRDANGLATQLTQPDPDGSGPLAAPVTQFQYDALQNLTQVTLPDSSTRTVVYDATLNRPLTATDELNRTTSFTYNSFGNRLSTADPLGNVTSYLVDSRGQVASVAWPDPDGAGPLSAPTTVYTRDTLGRVTTMTNPDSSSRTIAYDTADRVTSATDELGRVTSFTFDNLDRLTSTTQPDPDGAGPLTAPMTSFTYNAVSDVLTQTDPLGRVASFNYDVLDRLTQTTLPDPDGAGPLTSPVHTRAYNAASDLTSTTDSLGQVTSYGYDAGHRLTSVTQPDPDGGGPLVAPATSYVYDSLNRTTRVTDPLARQTNFAYDIRNRQTERTDPDPDGTGPLTSPVTTWVFDAASQLTSVTDPLSRVTSFSFDTNGRRTQTTLPDPDGGGPLSSPVYATAYDNLGRVLSQTDPLTNVTAFEYNNRSWQTKVTQPDPDGAGPLSAPVTTLAYNVVGELTSTTDPLSRVTSFLYDNLSRRTRVTLPDPDGGGPLTAPQYNTSFDAANNVLTETDPLGSVTSFEWDNLNRLQKRTAADPDGAGPLTSPITTFAYNAVGSVTSLTDPVNTTTTWAYDNLQRVTSETNALSGVRSFVYDAASNRTKVTDRNGKVREFTYDNLDRVTAEKWKAGSTVVRTLSYGFDAASQRTSASDPDAAYASTYDNLGRTLTTDNNGTPGVPRVILTSAYDAASRRTSVASSVNGTNDFQNSSTYDALDRMTSVQQSGQSGGATVADKRVDLSYTASGEFSTIIRYADLTGTNVVAATAYTYDQSHRLTNLDHTKGATNLANYSWTLDANGRISSTSNPDGSTSYTYDNGGQLTGATHSYQSNETYSYDANGNRTMTGYTTGTNNRLTSDGTSNYTYDAEGNRTRRTNIATGTYIDYAWDHRNRLTEVIFKTSAGVTTKMVVYTYDVYDRRISKRVDDNGNGTFGRAEQYVYDSASKRDPATGVPLDDIVLIFTDPDGDGPQPSALSTRLLHGPAIDQVFATESSTAEVLWSLTDNQGTVRDIAKYNSGTDTTSIVNHLKYDSFGKITSQTNSSYQPLHTYTGREWDSDASMNYYRARWYDPAAGRFISEDPLGFGAGDTNVSRYVANDALNATDPTGLWSMLAHHILLNQAFGNTNVFTKNQIGLLMLDGVVMDIDAERAKNDPGSSFKHFMLPVGINPTTKAPWTKKDAFKEAEDFVNQQMKDAKAYMAKGMNDKALIELGKAFHTVMDSTSPAHVDENGWPVAYVGANIKKHSPAEWMGEENGVALNAEEGQKTLLKTVELLQKAKEAFDSGTKFKFPMPGP
jgi:RHS repeat-associated protein